jgi:lipooligosaccharide transport system permease protein
MKPEALRLPSNSSSVYQVWRRNFLQFKRFWLVNFFWIVMEPLLILLAIGYGLGAFVSNIKGIAYVDFFFPALLCTSSMMVAFFEATYGNFSKLAFQKTYSTMILSPLDPKQIVLGEILWAATKGTISAAAVALIAGIFGHLDNLMLIPSILVIFLSSFLFASLGMLVTSMVRSYDGIIYPTSGLLVPMSLFSGTYFPLEQLPFGAQYLAYIFPLTHSVSMVRGILFSGISWWQFLLHFLMVLILAIVLTRWAIRKVTLKLVN